MRATSIYLNILVSIILGLGPILANAEDTAAAEETNAIEELNPFDPNVEETLRFYDKFYEEETGLSPFLEEDTEFDILARKCYRTSCKIWAHVSKSQQRLFLYINGQHAYTWKVSTGLPGFGTPNFDTHPNGRIYNRYTSTRYPGGDWKGLGNMPYAVFIRGGFAIHGTPKSNWPKLGSRASHGCIRLHPDHGQLFNELVRSAGKTDVWITVN